MSNIIDSIQLSGTTYQIQGSGGNNVVELTQAQYDALVSGGTLDLTTLYIITDASPQDMSYYWTSAQTQSAITQATSGKVNTSSVVSSVTSASTDSEIPTAKAVYDAIPQGGGGGKAIEGGRGITVTTGTTADTVSFNLAISAGTGSYSIVENHSANKAYQAYSHAEGYNSVANSYYAHAEGESCSAGTNYMHGYSAHAEGHNTFAKESQSHTEGSNTIAENFAEHASGFYNSSSKANEQFGHSGNTLFSVGNGTANNARHNAFEIRQNGDIYLNNGTSDVKLQDYLQIKVVKLTQQEYDALTTKDNNTLYVIT